MCDCKRCFALRQERNSVQDKYLAGPDFAALPPCPLVWTGPSREQWDALVARVNELEDFVVSR